MIFCLEHIDAISRKRNRDVIYIDFISPASLGEKNSKKINPKFLPNWEANLERIELITWLESEGIAWQPCAPFANPSVLEEKYSGQIYIDLPIEKSNIKFTRLEKFLENSDGTPRLRGVRFQFCSQEEALRNSEHDKPEYWDGRAW